MVCGSRPIASPTRCVGCSSKPIPAATQPWWPASSGCIRRREGGREALRNASRRQQAIAQGIERLRAADPLRFEETALRLRRYDQRLRRFGLRDRHLDWDVSPGAAAAFALREGIVALLLLPIAAVGFALFWAPYHLTGLLARQATSERDVAATAKVFVGAGVYAAWLLVIAIAVGMRFGLAAGIVTALLVPGLAVAGLFAIEREAAVADTIRAWWFLRRARRQTRARLKETRTELAALLEEIYEWLSAETRAQMDEQMPS